MTVQANRSSMLRSILLTSTALVGVFASTSAFAVCDPAAASNVTATCTGATANQNGTTGYGGFFSNFNVTVQPGASVTGTNLGMDTGFNSAITNAGTITGTTQYGVRLSGPNTLTNSGSVTGGMLGVLAANPTINNSGAITGGTTGIAAISLNLNNSGTIAGTTNVAIDAPTVNITNSGTVTSPFVAINAPSSATINNSGTMTSGFRTLLIGNGTVTNSGHISVTGVETNLAIFNIAGPLAVINSGSITSDGFGVAGNGTTSVTNSGSIVAKAYAVTSSGALTVTNSGTIKTTGASFTDAISADSTANVTNSGLIEGTGSALSASGAATVNNSGTMIGGFSGMSGATVTLTNSGTIRGGEGFGVFSTGTFNITNSGSISGVFTGIGTNAVAGGTVVNTGTITGEQSDGINHGQTLNLTNSGVITGGRFGVGANFAANTINATNSGTIFGTVVGLRANASGNVTNSGTIAGGSGVAIQFGATGGPASDTLTVLYGARFGGLVDFGFGADTVNFAKASWVLDTAKFNAALSTINTGGNPYLVTPNQIVVVDISSFAAMNRAIMDIAGWISSVLPDTPRPLAGSMSGGPAALAPIETLEARFEDVFAAFPRDAMGYTKAPMFRSGSATYADGSSVWAKSFGGRREQSTSATIFGNVTTGYGGALGYERAVTPDVRLGAFAGASTNRTEIGFNQGSTDTDVYFGGLYGRFMRGAAFLDLAAIGGLLDNSSVRNVSGGLALQVARAGYDGWYFNPSAALGHGFALETSSATTLTPAVKVRYVGAHFDGYTETGTTANLTIGARDIHAFEERGQLTLATTRDFGSWSHLTMHMTGGVLAQQRSAGATVNIALLGQNVLAATPDKANTAGAFGSTGFDWRIGNLLVFSAAEFTATDDANRTMSAKGGLRYTW